MTNPRAIPRTKWPWPPPGHTTSGAVRTGECNHEMPGLPYPTFRMVNAEPGGRQAVPLHLAQLDYDVGAGLVPALPVGMADFRAPTRGAPTLWHGRPARDRHGQDGRATIWLRLRRATLSGSAAMYTEGAASRPPTAKVLRASGSNLVADDSSRRLFQPVGLCPVVCGQL